MKDLGETEIYNWIYNLWREKDQSLKNLKQVSLSEVYSQSFRY
jgi:hypothetical protein